VTAALDAWVRALDYSKSAVGKTLPGMMDELAIAYGERSALVEDGAAISYVTLAARINRVARWASEQGLGDGDVVGLLMPNRIDYVVLWLALTRIGCTVALLNTKLGADALRHCITAAGSDTIIVAGELGQSVPFVRRVWNWDAIRRDADRQSSEPVTAVAPPRPDDRALLIYTSGTTGWPKATNITHRRIIEWSFWFAGMMDAQPTDRIYNCLPMYHSIGGVVAIGSMLVKGGSVFIRERFSASRFWQDVTQADCTIFQYIGELCRYLTTSEPHKLERSHRLRLACGNGLQGDVWRAFQERFAVPQILEFYAATEGNLSLYNCEGKPGAIGRVPPFLARHFPIAIIRCDIESNKPMRDAQGLCIRCANDEPGEAISRIDAGRQFDGYTDPEASKSKILQNVFADGDRWFRSGDLMRKDAGGYYYFLDRLGDTFRWKGENVSTTEVASVLRQTAGVLDAAVYGVTIEGNEGRAGIAAICVDDRFRFATLSADLKERLPDYAHPVFVRLCGSLDTTGTFKLNKTDLVRQGYIDVSDPIWQRDKKTGQYQKVVATSSPSN